MGALTSCKSNASCNDIKSTITNALNTKRLSSNENSNNLEIEGTIIWQEVKPPDELQHRLQGLTKFLKFYPEFDQCKKYLKSARVKDQVFLVLCDVNDPTVIPFASESAHVRSIYILFGENFSLSTDDYRLQDNTEKLSGIFHDRTDLICKLKQDIELLVQKDTTLSSHKTSITSNSLGERSFQPVSSNQPSFMWFQLLTEILLRMQSNSIDARKEMFDVCRRLHAQNPLILKKVEELSQTYSPTNAIAEYTKDGFLYRDLNKALRTENIGIIFKFRSFINDIFAQLHYVHSDFYSRHDDVITVYRGQLILAEELENILQQMFDDKGRNCVTYLSFNSFLSATYEFRVANVYVSGRTVNPFKPLIIHIKIPPRIDSKPFGFINHMSSIPDEVEFLFGMGCVFRADSFHWEEDIGHLKLCLCGDKDALGTSVSEFLKMEMGNVTDESTLSSYLADMGEYNQATQVLSFIINQGASTGTESDTAVLFNNIGWLYHCKSQDATALEYYQKAFHLLVQNEAKHGLQLAVIRNNFGMIYIRKNQNLAALRDFEMSLELKEKYGASNTSIAIALNNIGLAYQRNGALDESLFYYQKAFEKQAALPKEHPDLAITLSNIGMVQSQLRRKEEAIESFKKALTIRKGSLYPKHRAIGQTHLQLGIIYKEVFDYALAEEHFKEALNCQQASWASDLPDIGQTHVHLCSLFIERGQYEKALAHYKEARRIFSDSSPPKDTRFINVLSELDKLYENFGQYKEAK